MKQKFRNEAWCAVSALVAVVMSAAAAEDGCWTPASVEKFAGYLEEHGEPLRAAGEYYRLLASQEDKVERDRILYRIGRCSLRGGDTNGAVRVFRRVGDEFPGSVYAERAGCELAGALTGMGAYDESARYIEDHIAGLSDPGARLGMSQLEGINSMLLGNWRAAAAHFEAMRRWTGDTLTARLAELSERGLTRPRKKRWLAGAMSAVVPGSGKVYAGRYADGAYSFALVSLAGWQAWEGFRKEGVNSARGWIYGTIGGALYLGNIYGSVVSVQVFNEAGEKAVLDDVKTRIALTCEY